MHSVSLLELAVWIKEALINSAVRGEVLSLAKDRTMNTEFNKISILNLRDPLKSYLVPTLLRGNAYGGSVKWGMDSHGDPRTCNAGLCECLA